MRVTDFTSMFHESGFIFVAERASENRNGNREPSTRTKADIKAGKKNPDPRDHVSRRGSNFNRYSYDSDANSSVERGKKLIAKERDKATNALDKARRTNIPGSSNIKKAENRLITYKKGLEDSRAMDKYAKHKAKHESAELGFEII